jgi:hypothetical protein
MKITDQQIDYISETLTTNGIHSLDLKETILDHICTAIEADNSQDFETVYNSVITQFGGYASMKQIQKETTYTLQAKKMLQARKAFSIASSATAAVIIISALFKIMHWPFAGSLWLISFALVGLLCVPLYCYSKYMKSSLKIQR